MSKPKRYYVVMANSGGILETSDGVDTLTDARSKLIVMLRELEHVDGGDSFTVVDREPDKEPVYL